jgi:CheY-like chemotaxis protein
VGTLPAARDGMTSRSGVGASLGPRKWCGERILVVDDEPASRGLVVAGLVAAGYETVAVADGAEALDCLSEAAANGLRAPDALALDVCLPDLSGVALLERIRAAGCSAPAILLAPSPFWLHALWGRACQLGTAAMLARPFSLDELRAAVARALRG